MIAYQKDRYYLPVGSELHSAYVVHDTEKGEMSIQLSNGCLVYTRELSAYNISSTEEFIARIEEHGGPIFYKTEAEAITHVIQSLKKESNLLGEVRYKWECRLKELLKNE